MSTDLMHWKLSELCTHCEDERRAFHTETNRSSPACVELFKRAFAGNADAWGEIYRIFKPMLYGWIQDALQQGKGAFNHRQESAVEIEDLLQDALLAVYRSSSKRFRFEQVDQVGPILAYLQQAALTAVSQWLRKQHAQKRRANALLLLNDYAESIALSPKQDAMEQINFQLGLTAVLEPILASFSEQEKLLYHLKFTCGLTPKEIQAEHPNLFADYDKLEQSIKRIKLRLIKHKALNEFCTPRRKPQDSAFLKMVLDDEQQRGRAGMEQPCPYDEEILLDYLSGSAKPAIMAAIAAAPTCLEAVRQLAGEFAELETQLYRLSCPASSDIAAYVQQQLPGTERLQIYRHLAECPLCREEWGILNTIQNKMVSAEAPTLRQHLQRVIEAIYTPALEIGLLGEWLHYRTAEVFINISTRQNRSKARSWLVQAQVRTHEGQLLTPLVEQATLAALDQPALVSYQIHTPLTDSLLVFREVVAGHYCLSIVLPDNEIIIRRIAVGTEG